MHFYTVAVAAIVNRHNAVFTYHSAQVLAKGMLVRVPLGKTLANGVIMGKVVKPDFTTREIKAVLYGGAILPKPLLQLAEWLSAYYVAHLGLVWQSMLPPGLHKKRRVKDSSAPSVRRAKKAITLTNAQQEAVQAIIASNSTAFLLHGVPGSGKTQVYIEAAKHTLAKGRSVIVLVPEISLTPQLAAEFANYFTSTFIIHSRMTEAERGLAWQKIFLSDTPSVVVGPRSALFSPLQNIGLIIIDECHEQSFKQDRAPKYNTLYAGKSLAKLHRAKIVLGSATPNVTELYLAQQERLQVLRLDRPIQPSRNAIQIVPHSAREHFNKHRFISTPLLNAITNSLAAGEQALVFHNRRGTAPSVLCEQCGWQADCPACNLPLTFHADHMELRCHTCNFHNFVAHTCPECGNPTVVFKGIGTKLVTAELAKLFPQARIARFDADNSKDDRLQQRYQALYDGEIDILVGTQMIAKGLDVPGISTVGVLQADAGLHLPDFSAAERTFQLLYQVSGRAGRNQKAGQVILQTYAPNAPPVTHAAHHDFSGFAAAELAARRKQHYPPYCFLLLLTYSSRTEKHVIQNTRSFAQKLCATYQDIVISGPAPAFYEHQNNTFHWQILVKAKRRSVLVAIAAQLPANWQFDIDPVSLL